MSGFIARHELWTTRQDEAAAAVRDAVATLGVVRLAFADAHGVLRGKTLVAAEAAAVLRDGLTVTSTMLLKDLSGRTVFPVFQPGGGGAGDMVIVPDPTTFRVLPWVPHTGWLLCDIYRGDGTPHPLSTRALLRRALARLDARGWALRAGLEVEFHLFRLAPGQPSPDAGGPPGPPPAVTALNGGHQYLTELRYDALDPVMELLRGNLQALGLPLRSLEVEFGPSQVELTFGVMDALDAADAMLLLRSAVKQVCARHGYHASFMCRPRLPGAVSSGWHLHHSVVEAATGLNLFAHPDGLSPLARAWLGGLLAHARGAAAFAAPTINGYRRYQPGLMAPDRAVWARDNRGVMVRVLGDGGAGATRLENRVGEPAANPYLYIAAQVVCGLDGVDVGADPGPPAETPYATDAPLLPRGLPEALDALRADACMRAGFGADFIDYFAALKDAEVARFQADVSEWEHREYFALL